MYQTIKRLSIVCGALCIFETTAVLPDETACSKECFTLFELGRQVKAFVESVITDCKNGSRTLTDADIAFLPFDNSGFLTLPSDLNIKRE